MKVLFDTDIGSDIDDALALLLLLRIRGIDLVGVTTVYGCTDVRAKVAKKILDAAGHLSPVISGCGTPLKSPMPLWHAGTEGVGILSDEERTAPLEAMGIARGAEDFIVEAVQKHGDELVLVSLGALTNVANALRRVPSLKSCLSRVFFMGGGVTFRRPVPEKLTAGALYSADASHNIRCDVQAADEVFSSGIPMTILTNDVTTRVWWDGEPVRTLVSAISPPEAALVGKLLDVWLDYRTGIFGRRITGTCPHDPLTIAEVMAPQFVTYARGRMTIRRDGTTCFVPDEDGPHNVGVRVDADEFLKWFTKTILTAGSKPTDPGDV